MEDSMAHNLEQRDGQASMFFTGDVPWHQLGRHLNKPATAAEAMEAAKLDYSVVKRPMKAIINGRQYSDVPNAFATVRTDTNQVLGVVGARYEPVQNRDAFNFFDPLVDRDEAIYHTAGVLGRGEKIWLLAKLPDYIKVGRKGDPVEKFVLLYNSHDGSSHIRVKMTPIRVVCNNTLTAALSGTESEVRIKHTASATDKLQEAHKVLELTNQLYKELDNIFNAMALSNIGGQQLLDYVKALIPDNPKAENNQRTENMRERIISLHDTVQDATMHRGTLFGAYNAVTEYVDHYSSQKDANKQLRSIWFGGSGEQLKRRAYQLAESML
jgi:phage/plasmid-like protein (TIGR03299 family)